jgi:hypothetical protein
VTGTSERNTLFIMLLFANWFPLVGVLSHVQPPTGHHGRGNRSNPDGVFELVGVAAQNIFLELGPKHDVPHSALRLFAC